MSALAEALVAAQRTMLAAYSKRFIAGEEPSDLEGEEEDFRSDLDSVGLTDKLEQGYFLECLRGLRHMGVTAPTVAAPKAETDLASDKQKGLIRDLCARNKLPEPEDFEYLTKKQASEAIDALNAGTYDPGKWKLPF